MATATEMITALEDQVLETVRQSQEAVVKAVKTWAEAGKSMVPDLPPLPFADQLPNTVDIFENAFDFADKLLAAQPVISKADTVKTTNSRPPSKTSAN